MIFHKSLIFWSFLSVLFPAHFCYSDPEASPRTWPFSKDWRFFIIPVLDPPLVTWYKLSNNCLGRWCAFPPLCSQEGWDGCGLDYVLLYPDRWLATFLKGLSGSPHWIATSVDGFSDEEMKNLSTAWITLKSLHHWEVRILLRPKRLQGYEKSPTHPP